MLKHLRIQFSIWRQTLQQEAQEPQLLVEMVGLLRMHFLSWVDLALLEGQEERQEQMLVAPQEPLPLALQWGQESSDL